MSSFVGRARQRLSAALVDIAKWIKPSASVAAPGTRPIDELQAEWEGEYLKSFSDQVYDINHRRQVHDEFIGMLAAVGEDGGVFADMFHRMYIESMVMAVRRQTDTDPRALSLRRLIGQLVQHRRAFTRSWYVGRWVGNRDARSAELRERHMAEFHIEMANEAFDRFSDPHPKRRDILSAKVLQADLAELDRLTEQVVRFANAQVAHSERSSCPVSVTYGEFHAALDHLSEMLKRYYLLIDQGGLVSTTPTIQDDWLRPFRRPLVEESTGNGSSASVACPAWTLGRRWFSARRAKSGARPAT